MGSKKKLCLVDEMGAPAPFSRRAFIRNAALLGGGALLAARTAESAAAEAPGVFSITPKVDYALAKPEQILYSVCQQCITQCGIKVKIDNGVIAAIEGSPYSPWTMTPHVAYKSSPVQTAAVDGTLCPKGHAGVQSAYDPYRIVKVLKRAGKRGEGKWMFILTPSWKKARSTGLLLV